MSLRCRPEMPAREVRGSVMRRGSLRLFSRALGVFSQSYRGMDGKRACVFEVCNIMTWDTAITRDHLY